MTTIGGNLLLFTLPRVKPIRRRRQDSPASRELSGLTKVWALESSPSRPHTATRAVWEHNASSLFLSFETFSCVPAACGQLRRPIDLFEWSRGQRAEDEERKPEISGQSVAINQQVELTSSVPCYLLPFSRGQTLAHHGFATYLQSVEIPPLLRAYTT